MCGVPGHLLLHTWYLEIGIVVANMCKKKLNKLSTGSVLLESAVLYRVRDILFATAHISRLITWFERSDDDTQRLPMIVRLALSLSPPLSFSLSGSLPPPLFLSLGFSPLDCYCFEQHNATLHKVYVYMTLLEAEVCTFEWPLVASITLVLLVVYRFPHRNSLHARLYPALLQNRDDSSRMSRSLLKFNSGTNKSTKFYEHVPELPSFVFFFFFFFFFSFASPRYELLYFIDKRSHKDSNYRLILAF